ncbi:hypothetical protein BJ741DRAFT_589175 [Chytriomyces cf. hyalinus JEL632]|nr:hypothetical protein BJ741DRAFT_589175 [Chytriomyces cf. hyalinus JEL632]
MERKLALRQKARWTAMPCILTSVELLRVITLILLWLWRFPLNSVCLVQSSITCLICTLGKLINHLAANESRCSRPSRCTPQQVDMYGESCPYGPFCSLRTHTMRKMKSSVFAEI